MLLSGKEFAKKEKNRYKKKVFSVFISIMDFSLFLLQLMSVSYIVLGVSFLLHPKTYQKIIKEMRKNNLLLFFGGIVSFVIGFTLASIYSIFEPFPGFLLAYLGYIALFKGVFLLLLPDSFSDIMRILSRRKSILLLGGILLLVGLLLSFFVFPFLEIEKILF